MTNPRQAWRRYRDLAYLWGGAGGALSNDVPIAPGTNKEVAVAGQEGNIRWRHGNNDQANFLSADGTVRTMKITTGTPGTPNGRGDVLHKFLRIKTPAGFVGNG